MVHNIALRVLIYSKLESSKIIICGVFKIKLNKRCRNDFDKRQMLRFH